MTELVAKLENTQWSVVGGVLGSLSLLYLFLFLIVYRADTIIVAHGEEERLAQEEKLVHQAYHDSLTGLPNRAQFAGRLDEMLKRAKRNGAMCAVLFLDLDRFKDVNDSLGHFVGDRLLQRVGERLKRCLREVDIVARHSGDEFVVALPDITRVDQVTITAEKIREVLSDTAYSIDGHQLAVTASIGVSVYPADGGSMVELIKNADAAMYHGKQMGRNNFQFYAADMTAKALAALTMERDLRRALEEEEFFLHYQPQMEIGTGKIVGAEALIRWRHPEKGLVPSLQFIPIAEERGLIVSIGDWVLREACRQNREWQKAGLPQFPVAVNLSALQFRQSDLPKRVARFLKDSNLAPEHLELELTESAVMREPEAAVATMRQLKSVGLKLSLDDFGTGYSSLSYLKRFPLDKIKVDQSFVRGLPSDPDDLAIASAILAMAKALRLRTIAEGVEKNEQLEFLRSQDCDEIQGYLVSKPLPAADFAGLMRDQGSLRR